MCSARKKYNIGLSSLLLLMIFTVCSAKPTQQTVDFSWYTGKYAWKNRPDVKWGNCIYSRCGAKGCRRSFFIERAHPCVSLKRETKEEKAHSRAPRYLFKCCRIEYE